MSPPSARCSTGCSITATCSSVDLEAGGPRPRRPRRGTRAFFDARALPSRSRDLSLSARMAAEWGGLRRPTLPDPNRRSGRVPALPYPPSRLGQYKPSSGWFAKNACRNRHRRVINTLVLVQFRWPVLKWPRMAGFQVAAEGGRAFSLDIVAKLALLADSRTKVLKHMDHQRQCRIHPNLANPE